MGANGVSIAFGNAMGDHTPIHAHTLRYRKRPSTQKYEYMQGQGVLETATMGQTHLSI